MPVVFVQATMVIISGRFSVFRVFGSHSSSFLRLIAGSIAEATIRLYHSKKAAFKLENCSRSASIKYVDWLAGPVIQAIVVAHLGPRHRWAQLVCQLRHRNGVSRAHLAKDHQLRVAAGQEHFRLNIHQTPHILPSSHTVYERCPWQPIIGPSDHLLLAIITPRPFETGQRVLSRAASLSITRNQGPALHGFSSGKHLL